LAHVLASGSEEGYLDIWTTMMNLPARWHQDILSLYVRAHELVHLRLTYSTGFGIFLDMISGLSSAKLMNLLKEANEGELSFPLSRYLAQPEEATKELLGAIAFCYLCENCLGLGITSWRYLQEGVATFVMLELGPDKIMQEAAQANTSIDETKVQESRTLILRRLPAFYASGYRKCLAARNIVGTDYVYPAAIVASDLPLYTLQLFESEELTGDVFSREIERFVGCLSLEHMDPSSRFQAIIRRVKQKNVKLTEKTLDVFTQFVVPDLFPDGNWQREIDSFVCRLIARFGDFSPGLAPRALGFYRKMVDSGWTPMIAYHDEVGDTYFSIVKGQEHGLLRYMLGNLKMACFYGRPVTIYLPEKWKELDLSKWVEEFCTLVKKHKVPISIEFVSYEKNL
jgi:hypothetical protein